MHLFCIKPFLFDGPLRSVDKSLLLSSWMLDRCWLSGWDSVIDIIYRQGILCVYRSAIWILPTPFTADGCAQSQNEVGIVYFQREVEEREGSGCITSHPQL